MAKKELCKWRTEALHLKQLQCIQQLEKFDHNDESDCPVLTNGPDPNAIDRSTEAESVVIATAIIKTDNTDPLSRVIKTELFSDESGSEDGHLEVKFAKVLKVEPIFNDSQENVPPIEANSTVPDKKIFNPVCIDKTTNLSASLLQPTKDVNGTEVAKQEIPVCDSKSHLSIKTSSFTVKRIKIGSKMQGNPTEGVN